MVSVGCGFGRDIQGPEDQGAFASDILQKLGWIVIDGMTSSKGAVASERLTGSVGLMAAREKTSIRRRHRVETIKASNKITPNSLTILMKCGF